jgi:hypothetical protein
MALVNPKTILRIEATDVNFSHWKVFCNDTEITRDVMGIMLELNRGCLPLVTLQCTAILDLPEYFDAKIEAPKRLQI